MKREALSKFRRFQAWTWAYLPVLVLGGLTLLLVTIWLLEVDWNRVPWALWAGSGALFIGGVALTKGMDIWQQRRADDARREERELTEQDRRKQEEREGLDEVRRLLYMVEHAHEPASELVSTVTNAWVHHHKLKIEGVTTDKELIDFLVGYLKDPSEPRRQKLHSLREKATKARDDIEG